jgi:hypothetical protein
MKGPSGFLKGGINLKIVNFSSLRIWDSQISMINNKRVLLFGGFKQGQKKWGFLCFIHVKSRISIPRTPGSLILKCAAYFGRPIASVVFWVDQGPFHVSFGKRSVPWFTSFHPKLHRFVFLLLEEIIILEDVFFGGLAILVKEFFLGLEWWGLDPVGMGWRHRLRPSQPKSKEEKSS